jgi:replicative DNA helicase
MTHQDQDRTEQAVLGGMLRWPDTIGEVAAVLRAGDFRSGHHQAIFTAVVGLWDAGRPVDAVGVADVLHRQGQVENVGGYGYLGSLLELEPSGAGTVHHARVVRERSVIRALHGAAQEILRDTAAGAGSAEQLLEEAERKLYAVGEAGYGGGAVPVRQSVDEMFDRIDERARRKGQLAGLPTGLRDLDGLTSGLHDSEVTILAARTSVGKTTLAVQIASHAAVNLGLPVLFVSLEMSRVELAERLACALGGVDSQRLRQGEPSEGDATRLIAARDRLRPAPLHIDHEPHQRMVRIAAAARRLKRREGLRLLVLDYVQLVEPEDKKVPRHEQVAQVSRRLKGLAKELNVPVLALAQLSRAAEERERPRLHHLRESGSLEQDADCVLLMHRSDEEPGVVEVDVAKQRNGPTGTVKLVFRKAFTRFDDYGYAPAQPSGG